VTKEDSLVQIIPLQKASSISDVVAQAYGLKSTDPLAAAAAQALTNANLPLTGDISALAPNTPIIVPTLPGATTTTTNVVDTNAAMLGGLVAKLQQSLQQAQAAPPVQSGQTTADPTTIAELGVVQSGFEKVDVGAFLT
jgi:hypothetical protein